MMKGILKNAQSAAFSGFSEITFEGGVLSKDTIKSNNEILPAGTVVSKAVFNFEQGWAQFSDSNNNILAAFDLKVELVPR